MSLEVTMSNEKKHRYTLADHLGVSLSAIRRWVKAEKGPEEKALKIILA